MTTINARTENLPATRGREVENILDAAQENAGFDKLLKFKKGDYLIGDEPVPLGTQYIAHAVGWTKSWIKFVDGEVVDRKTYRVAYGERPPVREDLDDLDQDKWPRPLFEIVGWDEIAGGNETPPCRISSSAFPPWPIL
jgi:hypothetical protein